MVKYTPSEERAYWKGYEQGRQSAIFYNIMILAKQYRESEKAEKINDKAFKVKKKRMKQ